MFMFVHQMRQSIAKALKNHAYHQNAVIRIINFKLATIIWIWFHFSICLTVVAFSNKYIPAKNQNAQSLADIHQFNVKTCRIACLPIAWESSEQITLTYKTKRNKHIPNWIAWTDTAHTIVGKFVCVKCIWHWIAVPGDIGEIKWLNTHSIFRRMNHNVSHIHYSYGAVLLDAITLSTAQRPPPNAKL